MASAAINMTDMNAASAHIPAASAHIPPSSLQTVAPANDYLIANSTSNTAPLAVTENGDGTPTAMTPTTLTSAIVTITSTPATLQTPVLPTSK